MKKAKSKAAPPLPTEGYRVQITDAERNCAAITRRMPLNDALSVIREWIPVDGATVSIVVPKPDKESKGGGA